MFGTAGKPRQKRNMTGFLFILPTLLVLAVLLLYPVLASIFYSFTSKHLLKPTYGFVGLKNYIEVLKDPAFYSAFWVSIRWTFFSLLGQLLVGFTAALALNRIRRFQGILRTVLIIPWAFPSIVIALSWKWILNGVYGFVPLLLQKIGITESVPQFFSDFSLVFIVNQRIIAGNAQFTGIAAGRGVGFTTGLLLLREGLGMRETPIRPHSWH